MGLYIFCKDSLSEMEVMKTIRYTLDLQKYADGGYDTLFLSEVNELHVCNLRDGISDSARLASYEIPQDMRRDFFLRSL